MDKKVILSQDHGVHGMTEVYDLERHKECLKRKVDGLIDSNPVEISFVFECKKNRLEPGQAMAEPKKDKVEMDYRAVIEAQIEALNEKQKFLREKNDRFDEACKIVEFKKEAELKEQVSEQPKYSLTNELIDRVNNGKGISKAQYHVSKIMESLECILQDEH